MEHAPKVLKSFCTTGEAAQLLGVSLRTAQLWTEGGLLQAWKTHGGHRRISRRSVEKLLASQPNELPAQEAKRDQSAEGLTILVVDDEPAVLRLYEQHMQRWPMKPRVVTAQNGLEALVRLGLSRPDLLVTDLHMPDMHGFHMLHQLSMILELAEMVTVVVTGLDRQDVAARGGVPDGILVLSKPIAFDRLRDIATVIAGRKSARAGPNTRVAASFP